MSDRNAHLPGRLSNPAATLEEDPRTDPRLVAAMNAMADLAPDPLEISADASYEEAVAYCLASEQAAAEGNAALLAALTTPDTVENSTETIQGVDGNDIKLYIHRPRNVSGDVPCVVHTHGGGMVLMTAEDPMFVRWRNSIADAGLVVVGIEFRNGGGRLGNHPFPAGLNDCASGTQWTHEHRRDLGISNIVISGESGGGNLSIATTLKARKEGWVDQISGVYAMCPYISGAYGNPPPELLSLYENDGYMLQCEQMAALMKVYDPTGDNANNPLAWPLTATPEDLAGLPPHIISVNELDPLRDEGLAFYRKLMAAGVSVSARQVHGTPHAGDVGFPDIAPEYYQETLRSLVGFARSLAA